MSEVVLKSVETEEHIVKIIKFESGNLDASLTRPLAVTSKHLANGITGIYAYESMEDAEIRFDAYVKTGLPWPDHNERLK
jgi:hypothetical protein